jgi:tetratricopeptide (TPR) repeat protein
MLDEGSYAEAEAAYTRLLQEKPGTPEILLKRGAARIMLFKHEQARVDLETVISDPKLDPSLLFAAHSELGMLDRYTGRYGKAIYHLSRAAAVSQGLMGSRDPIVGTMWGRLGEAHLAAGGTGEAIEALNKAITILEGVPGREFQLCLAHTSKGLAQTARHLYQDAAQSFRAAQAANKIENGCTALMASGFGQLYFELGEMSEANSKFRECIRIGNRLWPAGHPVVGGALQGLARVAVAENRLGEARQRFEQSLDLFEQLLGPKHVEVQNVLLDLLGLLHATHKNREARQLAARIRRDFPESSQSISIQALKRR